MTKHGLDACGGGGWTLVMKVDGTKVKKLNVLTSFNVCHNLIPNVKVNLQFKSRSTSNERKGNYYV